jgi:hypothetical protein
MEMCGEQLCEIEQEKANESKKYQGKGDAEFSKHGDFDISGIFARR